MEGNLFKCWDRPYGIIFLVNLEIWRGLISLSTTVKIITLTLLARSEVMLEIETEIEITLEMVTDQDWITLI